MQAHNITLSEFDPPLLQEQRGHGSAVLYTSGPSAFFRGLTSFMQVEDQFGDHIKLLKFSADLTIIKKYK